MKYILETEMSGIRQRSEKTGSEIATVYNVHLMMGGMYSKFAVYAADGTMKKVDLYSIPEVLDMMGPDEDLDNL